MSKKQQSVMLANASIQLTRLLIQIPLDTGIRQYDVRL